MIYPFAQVCCAPRTRPPCTPVVPDARTHLLTVIGQAATFRTTRTVKNSENSENSAWVRRWFVVAEPQPATAKEFQPLISRRKKLNNCILRTWNASFSRSYLGIQVKKWYDYATKSMSFINFTNFILIILEFKWKHHMKSMVFIQTTIFGFWRIVFNFQELPLIMLDV